MKEILDALRKEAQVKSSQPVTLKRKTIRELVAYLDDSDKMIERCISAINSGQELAHSVKAEASFRSLTGLVKRANVFIGEAINAKQRGSL